MQKNSRNSGRGYLYSQILDKIQYCEWAPGTCINETSLGEAYGVSKTPVREALLLLAKEHFLDIFPQSGSYVSKIDLKLISDILFLRNSVEKTICLDLAEKKTPTPSSIRKSFLLIQYAVKEEDWKECVRLDYNFHSTLFAMADRSEAWEIIEKSLPHWTRYRFFSQLGFQEYRRTPSTQDEHIQIMEYIAEGNVSDLKVLLDKHLDVSFKRPYIREMIQNNHQSFINYETLV